MTVLNPVSGYGIVTFDADQSVVQFQEKPRLDIWINGGFFVFNRRIFDYLTENCVLEKEPLEQMAAQRQLAAYPHPGFWASMDTYKDFQELNNLWLRGNAPWKVWED